MPQHSASAVNLKTEESKFHENLENLLSKDPLLSCLMTLCDLLKKPSTLESLLANIPFDGDPITPELFVRAANQNGLKAQISKKALDELTNAVLPAVILFKDKSAGILLSIDGKNTKVMLPTKQQGTQSMTLAHLQKQYTGSLIYVKPEFKISARAQDIFKTAKKQWFWSVIKDAWPVYSEVLVASLLINLFALAVPLFIMNVYDRVVPNYAIETMWVLALGVGLVFIFDFIMRTLRAYFIDVAGKRIDTQLSAQIFQQILGIKMAARPQSVGAFANTVQSFELFRDFITSTTISALVDLPFVILFIFIIGLIGGPLFWIPLILVPLTLGVGLLLQMPMTELTKESFRHAAEKQATLIESLGTAEAIKSTGAESAMQKRWEQIIAMSSKLGIKLRFISNASIHFSIFVQHLATILVVIGGVYLISEGEMTVGALIACTILTGRALAPMSQIAAVMTRYHQSINALTSLQQVMSLPVDRPEGKTYLHRGQFKGDITLKNLTFTYPGEESPTLNDLSLSIKAGERVGILGRVGSGKTTVAKLMLSLYQPDSGSVLIDNTDAKQIDPAQLRHEMGYMPQDVVLFYGSLKDNLTMGAPGISDAAILKATEIAGLDGYVNQHPQGFDLQVGERGTNLSGGQRQMVAVARALLLDPPIVLLDEPTTAMDDATETRFRKNFMAYSQAKTIVLVTHKPAMLSLVDRLIIIDKGKVVADGKKEAVLSALSEGKIKIK